MDYFYNPQLLRHRHRHSSLSLHPSLLCLLFTIAFFLILYSLTFLFSIFFISITLSVFEGNSWHMRAKEWAWSCFCSHLLIRKWTKSSAGLFLHTCICVLVLVTSPSCLFPLMSLHCSLVFPFMFYVISPLSPPVLSNSIFLFLCRRKICEVSTVLQLAPF